MQSKLWKDDNIAYKNTKHKRDLNRYKWEINKIEQLLNQNSKENKIYNAFKQLLKRMYETDRKSVKDMFPKSLEWTFSNSIKTVKNLMLLHSSENESKRKREAHK